MNESVFSMAEITFGNPSKVLENSFPFGPPLSALRVTVTVVSGFTGHDKAMEAFPTEPFGRNRR